MKAWVKEHTENIFVTAGGTLFRQIKGVPMAASAAPMIANLTLFMAEYKYIRMIAGMIRDVGERQWQVLRQLSYYNRFIDDLLNLCMDREEFNGIALDIYSTIGLKITDET